MSASADYGPPTGLPIPVDVPLNGLVDDLFIFNCYIENYNKFSNKSDIK